jgi:DNA mismatch repair protein MutL
LATYIVVEKNEGIVLIDKHAAHERAIFDKLKAAPVKIMSQALIAPVIADLGRENTAMLMENKELLEELGFEADEFGVGHIALRRVPADIDAHGAEEMLSEVCDKLAHGKRLSASELRDELLHSIACKAAIKAGRRSGPAEAEKIAQMVLAGDIRYCPHGRPVSMELTKQALDRGFRRI